MTESENQNIQRIDIIERINDEVLGRTEAIALGSLYQAVSHALSLGALNAVSAQQQSDVTSQAVTTMGATTLYSVVTAANSRFIIDQKNTGAVLTQ